jgi:DNA-binding transcriptional MerR regulator
VAEPSLSIGEVAAQVGLRTSAVRFYEDAGLLPEPERVSGRRRYDPETVDRLLFLRFCQRVGFSLDELRELVAAPSCAGEEERWRQLVDAKIARVDAVIDDARTVRRALEESRDCSCVTLDACRLVREERVLAEQGEPRRRRSLKL